MMDYETSLRTLEQQLESVRSTTLLLNSDVEGITDELLQQSSIGVFALEASGTVSALRQVSDGLKEKFNDVLSYLAPEGDVKPIVLFGIVTSFCNDLDLVRSQLAKKAEKKKFRGMKKYL